jgi:hypothetical protein
LRQSLTKYHRRANYDVAKQVDFDAWRRIEGKR